MAMHYEYWNWAAVTRRLGDLWLLARSMSRNGSEEKVLFLRTEKKVTLCVLCNRLFRALRGLELGGSYAHRWWFMAARSLSVL